MEALKAAAAASKMQILRWPEEGVDPLKEVLYDLLNQLRWSSGDRSERVPELVKLFQGKLGSDLFGQQEPMGCDKLIAYLQGLLPAPLLDQPETGIDWESAFFDSTGTRDRAGAAHLLLKLDEHAKAWDGGLVWQAPFAAVVQSSGWGKSWSICELRNDGVFVIYCSFMKAGHTGFPRRSEVAKCFDAPMSEALVCAYLRASLEVLADSDLSPRLWLECQIRHDMINEVGKAILQKHNKILPEMQQQDRSQLEESLLAAVLDMRERKKTLLRQGPVQVLFVFDEGRGLTNFHETFSVFRKGLGYLPVKSGLFVVLADTNASVAGNFAPCQEMDPSGRSRARGQKLFDPIHLIGRADLFLNRAGPFLRRADLLPQQLFLNGRPLWGAHYSKSVGAERQRLKELVCFVVRKLLGGKTMTNLTKVDAAAVFMACIGPKVFSRSYLAQDLVAGHMATCVATGTTDDHEWRQRIITVHPNPSEAVLGEAAAFILHESKFLIPALHFLADLLTEGLVLEGVRGELVMRMILLLCMHKCVQRTAAPTAIYYTGHVTLGTFLQTMFGPGWDVRKSKSAYLDAFVCFNHFIPLCRGAAITKNRLMDFLVHGAALLYPPGEFAADIGIPWVLFDTQGAITDVGIFNVQVKHLTSYQTTNAWKKLKLWHRKMFPNQDQPPVVITTLGSTDEVLEQEQSATVAFGISAEMYPFLKEEVVGALNQVLAAKTDFRAHVTKHELELVRKMAVLSL